MKEKNKPKKWKKAKKKKCSTFTFWMNKQLLDGMQIIGDVTTQLDDAHDDGLVEAEGG